MTVTDSTISENSANFGGGIENYGTLMVSGATISDNTAGGGSSSGAQGGEGGEVGAYLVLNSPSASPMASPTASPTASPSATSTASASATAPATASATACAALTLPDTGGPVSLIVLAPPALLVGSGILAFRLVSHS